MAFITGKKKNVLDINEDITIGVAFPLNEVNMFKGTTTTHEQTKANLLNLMMTHPGERINLPTYGIGLKNLLFEQKIDQKLLIKNIQKQVERYIPMVSVKDVITSLSDDKHTVFVIVSYIYLLDGSINNVQLNFN